MNPLFEESKYSQFLWLKLGGGFFLILSCLLLITNPGQKQYEEFASEKLVEYLRENICQARSTTLEEAIKSQMCTLMLETGKNQVPKLIRETTTRTNFALLSLYETNLYIYNIETIGVFNHFFVIAIDKLYDSE